MSYIKYVPLLYIGIALMSCNASEMTDKSVGEQQEISPGDQEQQSPRKITFLGKNIDLRKAIANSSPRRVESPRKNSSRDDIEKQSGSLSKESSPRDLESPRTRLKRSQSMSGLPQKDNKTLRDVKALEEGSSPRGEEIVLSLLRKTTEKQKSDQSQEEDDDQKEELFRRKSMPKVDFTLSSPSPRLLIEKHEKSAIDKRNELITAKNKEHFNATLKELVTNHEQRLLAKQSKELQKQQEELA